MILRPWYVIEYDRHRCSSSIVSCHFCSRGAARRAARFARPYEYSLTEPRFTWMVTHR